MWRPLPRVCPLSKQHNLLLPVAEEGGGRAKQVNPVEACDSCCTSVPVRAPPICQPLGQTWSGVGCGFGVPLWVAHPPHGGRGKLIHSNRQVSCSEPAPSLQLPALFFHRNPTQCTHLTHARHLGGMLASCPSAGIQTCRQGVLHVRLDAASRGRWGACRGVGRPVRTCFENVSHQRRVPTIQQLRLSLACLCSAPLTHKPPSPPSPHINVTCTRTARGSYGPVPSQSLQ